MNKKIFALALTSLLVLFSLASLTSAYYYNYYPSYNYGGYGGNNFDSYSYQTSRTSGSGPYMNTRTTNYDRSTSSRYLSDGTYETITHNMRTTRASPNYQNYGYNNYQPSSYYNNYQPYNYYNNRYWYQKYWNQPNYYGMNYNYGYNNMPTMMGSYGYGY